MKGKLRRVLSLVCAVALLAACCISAFGTPASAVDTSNAKDTKWVYDFKSGTGTGDEKPSFLANHESWFYNSTTGKSSVNADGLYVGTGTIQVIRLHRHMMPYGLKRSGSGMPIMTIPLPTATPSPIRL